MIKIILADDHSIMRGGLKKLIEQLENVMVVKECANGVEVMDFVETNEKVDVVISDLNMPVMSGMELTMALRYAYPEIKIIILSMYEDLNQVALAIQAGASGYLLKSSEMEELEFAIKMVSKNHRYIGIALIDKMIKNQLHVTNNPQIVDRNHYTERELEVLSLIAEGMTNVEISNSLFLSKRTVEGHRQNLLLKTGSKNTATLIRYAIASKLIN